MNIGYLESEHRHEQHFFLGHVPGELILCQIDMGYWVILSIQKDLKDEYRTWVLVNNLSSSLFWLLALRIVVSNIEITGAGLKQRPLTDAIEFIIL